MTAIADIRPGTPFSKIYAVRDVERRLARNGKPFLMTLGDATGNARSCSTRPTGSPSASARSAVVRVTGRAEEQGGQRER